MAEGRYDPQLRPARGAAVLTGSRPNVLASPVLKEWIRRAENQVPAKTTPPPTQTGAVVRIYSHD